MNKELRSLDITFSTKFNYIPISDRYLMDRQQAAHRFNIIGAGVNGQEHIRVTMLEGRSTIHGIYDPNASSVAAAQHEYALYAPTEALTIYDSLEAACMDPAVDGLVICTPNYTHLDVVKEAIKSGKHILLEKPIATTLADAHTIMQIAEQYDAIFQIGLQYRYKAIYAESIYEALERKTLGNLQTLTILEHRVPFMDKVSQWNKFSKFSGNTLIEKCCHYFDLFNLFAQSRPVSVFATGSMAVNFTHFEYNGEKSDILDNAMVIVNYASGVTANFNLCMFAPMIYEELVICGDEARLKAWENEDFLPEQKAGTHLEIIAGENKRSRVMTPMYPASIQRTGHHGATYFEHVDFVDNIEGRPTKSPSARDGFWSIAVAAAAQESITTGRVVLIEDMLASTGIDPTQV